MNSVFGIKNTEFIIGLKKMIKLVCLATWGARMVLAVVVDCNIPKYTLTVL